MRGVDLSPVSTNEQIDRISHAARRWIVPLARFGYAANGVVYILIGGLAMLAAFYRGRGITDFHGAFKEILSHPYGQVMLAAIAVGLAAYALWRLIQAIKDTENKGSGAKGIAIRLGYAMIGLIYTGLALTAGQLIAGAGGRRSGDQSSKEWTATLLAQPLGQWLVGAVGIGIIAVGLCQFFQAYTAKSLEPLKWGEMSAKAEAWATRVGRIGLASRGVVFAIIGVFLLYAALRANPNEARGLSGALRAIAQQPFGPWLLGVVALGLVAYGVYMLVLARYRHIIL
jgi:Domain of Unknown Function (DUF1206)